MRKFKLMLAAALLFGAVALPANALTGTAIYVNGQYLAMDTMPVLAENTTFVPLRAVSEALGASVEWVEQAAPYEPWVSIMQGKTKIVLRVDDKRAYVSGGTGADGEVIMPVAPRLQGDRVLVPLRFVSEQLGAQVDYADHQIDITAENVAVDLPSVYQTCYEDRDYIYLATGGVNMLKLDKQTGAQSVITLPVSYPLLIAPADNTVYDHDADGNTLMCYGIEDGSEIGVATNGGTPKICGGYLYYLLNNEKTGAHDLYRVKLVEGKPAGEAALVSRYVQRYFFAGGQVYMVSAGGKLFRANLDGGAYTEIVPPASDEKLSFKAFDSGYFYYSDNRMPGTKLYRFKQPGVGGGSVWEPVCDFAGREIDRLVDMQVCGNRIYFNSMKYAEYAEGRYGVVTGPLWEMDLDGGNLRQLTEDKAIAFYVLSDKIVYQTQVGDGYPQVGGDWGVWRVIDR